MFEFILLIIITSLLITIHIFKHKKESEEKKLLSTDTESLIRKSSEIFRRLPNDIREQSSNYCAILMDKLKFEGCRGASPDEQIKALTAFHAGLLCCGMKTLSPYKTIRSVLIYPQQFFSREEGGIGENNGGYIVEESVEKIGESWEIGTVILSAREIIEDSKNPEDGMNIIIHEFAHQLEFACPSPPHDKFDRNLFKGTMKNQYELFRIKTQKGELDPVIDEYAAESPSEFFAVVSEAFFTIAPSLRELHPELYRAMQSYYKLDPAEWIRTPDPFPEASEQPEYPRCGQP